MPGINKNMRDNAGVVHLPHPVMGQGNSDARSWWLSCCNVDVLNVYAHSEYTNDAATCLICMGSATGRYLEAKRAANGREP